VQVPAGEQTWPSPHTVPGLSAVQVPGAVGNPQDSQAPPQARSQQVPLSQIPDVQSAGARQAPPLGFLPHDPPMQVAGGTQSPSLRQAVKQSLPLHWKGAQTVACPATQLPCPLQADTARWAAMAQLSGAHSVPASYSRQAPFPSHLPSWPQEAAFASMHMARGSGRPAAMLVHMPGATAMAHERQGPLQASLQQTPSMQNPERHCVPDWHPAPSSLTPQLPLTQRPPGLQSPSFRQVSRQAPPAQAKGAQSITAPAPHSPCPLQVLAKRRRIPASQTGGPHSVPTGYSAQDPLPSQAPVWPQLWAPRSAHLPLGSAFPEAVRVQMPMEPIWLQEVHEPVHSPSQQTPSTQKPVPHSSALAQAAPTNFLPQLPPTQGRPSAHWAEVEQPP
jgi:hypothetical protein